MDTIAAQHNGTPVTCQHQDAGYCARCAQHAPANFCWMDRSHAYQFASADDAVAFCRAVR